MTVAHGVRETLAAALAEARRRSLDLLDPLSDADLERQHSPLMSPLAWDLAHVANYEDLWLVRALGHDGLRGADVDDLYDAFRHARADRPALPLLRPAEARRYGVEVRDRALDLLSSVDLDDGSPVAARGFVYAMVTQHEHQHDETMLATLQLLDPSDGGYAARRDLSTLPAIGPRPVAPPEMRVVAEGAFMMGTDDTTSAYDTAWALDNERPAHRVDLPAFAIESTPVTNARFAEFVADGGYRERRWWSEAGWDHRVAQDLEHPDAWRAEGAGAWSVLRYGARVDLVPDEPVQHVCWFEAEAFARWAGHRLPTEAEWEKAMQQGLLDGTGEVWEWTASDFTAYPGFRAFPYPEYSEVFFPPRVTPGTYKVLRGGSWATHPTARRTTFRNWDHPIRRQIFSGFRCAGAA